jgi:hypothetical protein
MPTITRSGLVAEVAAPSLVLRFFRVFRYFITRRMTVSRVVDATGAARRDPNYNGGYN